jgi:hypothetical protein
LNQYGVIENFPPGVLGERRALALLFKGLATLRADAALFESVDQLRWAGPTPGFASFAQHIGAERVLERCLRSPTTKATAGSSEDEPAATA